MTASRLQSFIQQNIGAILSEWEVFAKTRIPAAATMSVLELRDHAEEMLLAIAEDIGRPQSEDPTRAKSKRPGRCRRWAHHSRIGTRRDSSPVRLRSDPGGSEFRALRAAVLRLWGAEGVWEPEDVEDLTRFSESIDQALAESVAAYSAKIDESRDTFLAVLGHDLRGPLATLSNCVQLQGGAGQTSELATASCTSRRGASPRWTR